MESLQVKVKAKKKPVTFIFVVKYFVITKKEKKQQETNK